jgi:hypothetical protein
MRQHGVQQENRLPIVSLEMRANDEG